MLLTSTSAATYQWYLNGTLIPGATAQNYTTTTGGNYYVEVTYFNTCPYQSNTINLVSTAISVLATGYELRVFPNPAKGEFNISLISDKQESVRIRMLNVVGQVVFERFINTLPGGEVVLQEDVFGIDRGIYFIEASFRSSNHIQKVILQ